MKAVTKLNTRLERVESSELQVEEKLMTVDRVTKVVKGGRRLSFSALIVVGDGNGKVGSGKAKASEVPEAIRKAIENAKKNMFEIPLINERTIPHPINGKFGAGNVMLKPASAGTGVIAGGPVRAVLEAAGLKDILSKSLGSNNSTNMVHATINGLKNLKRVEDVARMRGKTVKEILY